MFQGLFGRRKHNSGFYEHIEAPAADINGGALTFSFVHPYTKPGIAIRGAGRNAGTFYATEAPFLSLFPAGQRNDILQNSTGTIYSQESNAIIGGE